VRRSRWSLVGALLLTLVASLASPVAVSASTPRPGPHHSFDVWRGGHASLPGHTVFRPARLSEVAFRMPIVVWGNGGCRRSNEEYRYFLTRFASYGVFIVANGAPENPYHPEELDGILDPKPELLIEGIDWALRQNEDPRSPYFRRLDPNRVLVMGQSCGGWEATDASKDPRVTSTVVWNRGTDAHNPGGVLELHAPVLFAYGGTSDYVSWDAVASYHATDVPAVLASQEGAGHTGWWDDPADGSPPPGPYQDEPLRVAARWMAFTLYDSTTGRDFFLGDDCGLCSRSDWTVEAKNWS
jgi:hypothetical protein